MNQSFERYGGELPLGSDILLKRPAPLNNSTLLFSHGRAAIAWFLDTRGPFTTAFVCAYTCPSVPDFMKAKGLDIIFYDCGESDFSILARRAKGKVILLLPALFGMAPWLNVRELSNNLGDRFSIIIDAAQSAFGHLDFTPPLNGAVLSCPRKALSISDGAALQISNICPNDYKMVQALPVADRASTLKERAREILALQDPKREAEALAISAAAENSLPQYACRISELSKRRFLLIDKKKTNQRRIDNATILTAELSDLPLLLPNGPGVPFFWPFAIKNRHAVLDRLHRLRVFATPLWADIPLLSAAGNRRYPAAHRLSSELVGLPVDQRYSDQDMYKIASLVRSCL